MKRRKNPDSTFVEKLRSATTLKVKYGGAYHQIPPTILNQARKFATQSVGVNYDVFAHENPVPSGKTDAEIQAAFEDFLEGYLESIMPLANPTTPKAAKVFEALPEFFDSTKKGTLGGWALNQRQEKEYKTIMRSAVVKLSQMYLEGACRFRLHDKKEQREMDQDAWDKFQAGLITEEEFYNQTKVGVVYGRADTAYREGARSDWEKARVLHARTVRNVFTMAVALVATKLLQTDGNKFRQAVAEMVDGLPKENLEGDNLKSVLLQPFAAALNNQLGDIDLIDACRRTRVRPEPIKPLQPKEKKKKRHLSSVRPQEPKGKAG